jgi:hypothetical protein
MVHHAGTVASVGERNSKRFLTEREYAILAISDEVCVLHGRFLTGRRGQKTGKALVTAGALSLAAGSPVATLVQNGMLPGG